MDFAGRVWHDAEGDVRTRVDYLSVMFEAALMSGDIGVAGAANVELGGLQTGEYVQGLRYALRVRRGETMMWRLGLPCVAYVALLERAACVAEVVRLFGSFRDGEAMSDGGDGTDVLEATFRALRRLGAAREAVELLAEMEATETFVASNRIVTMVIETCWRAGEMKLAKKLRVRAVCQ